MRKQSSIVLILIGLLFLAGCGGSSPSVQEFSVVTFGILGQITAGPDGNLWFTSNSHQIGRITPAGQITAFSLPTPSSLGGITAGPDGNLWFTLADSIQLGWVTPAGQISYVDLPPSASTPFALTSGPAGTLWFTQDHDIGRLTPAR